jgi:carbohydrate kinase (thermoresistant glucokinase family)
MIADIRGGSFLDGDDYHPPNNVAWMAKGKPLTDQMRWPWLDLLEKAVQEERTHSFTVFACSALRKSYRDHLRAAIPDLKIVYLEADEDVIAKRVSERSEHFMPVSLLRSQYATLEPPKSVFQRIDMHQSPELVADALGKIF